MLEPQRTNLIPNSEYFGSWSDALGCDIYTNTETSPEGVYNAATISFGSSGDSRAFVSASNSSATYIFSVYAKSSTSKKFRFRISGSGGTQYSDDLTTTSEWQRFEFEYTGDVTAVGITNASTADGGSIFVYGFQQEAGSYATSYIPTYGSSVSRGQDICFITNLKNNVTTGATQGSVMIDFTRDGFHSTGDAIQVYGDTSNGRGYVYNTGIGFASNWGLGTHNISYGTDYKVLYRLNTLSTGNIFLNGSKSAEASGSSWGSINAIYLRGNHGTLKIRQVLVSTTALTDQEAIDLTTI